LGHVPALFIFGTSDDSSLEYVPNSIADNLVCVLILIHDRDDLNWCLDILATIPSGSPFRVMADL